MKKKAMKPKKASTKKAKPTGSKRRLRRRGKNPTDIHGGEPPIVGRGSAGHGRDTGTNILEPGDVSHGLYSFRQGGGGPLEPPYGARPGRGDRPIRTPPNVLESATPMDMYNANDNFAYVNGFRYRNGSKEHRDALKANLPPEPVVEAMDVEGPQPKRDYLEPNSYGQGAAVAPSGGGGGHVVDVAKSHSRLDKRLDALEQMLRDHVENARKIVDEMRKKADASELDNRKIYEALNKVEKQVQQGKIDVEKMGDAFVQDLDNRERRLRFQMQRLEEQTQGDIQHGAMMQQGLLEGLGEVQDVVNRNADRAQELEAMATDTKRRVRGLQNRVVRHDVRLNDITDAVLELGAAAGGGGGAGVPGSSDAGLGPGSSIYGPGAAGMSTVESTNVQPASLQGQGLPMQNAAELSADMGVSIGGVNPNDHSLAVRGGGGMRTGDILTVNDAIRGTVGGPDAGVARLASVAGLTSPAGSGEATVQHKKVRPTPQIQTASAVDGGGGPSFGQNDLMAVSQNSGAGGSGDSVQMVPGQTQQTGMPAAQIQPSTAGGQDDASSAPGLVPYVNPFLDTLYGANTPTPYDMVQIGPDFTAYHGGNPRHPNYHDDRRNLGAPTPYEPVTDAQMEQYAPAYGFQYGQMPFIDPVANAPDETLLQIV